MKIPQPKSFEQILGEMLAEYMAKTGINDLNPGSLVTQFFETVALATAKASAESFQIFRDSTIDSASGDALIALAADENITPLPAIPASGFITIKDTNFEKISTKIYAAAPAPNLGTTVLFVNDASNFPPTGSIYIGRGTANEEGPIAYSSLVNLGSYWQINLLTPTTRFHNHNETVILAQGGTRVIPANTMVKATGTGGNPDIVFKTQQDAILLDGENEISNILVVAEEPGTKGNVPANTINEFVVAPFPGAAVTNPQPFVSGRDPESEEELRTRIKNARLARGLGTATAIKTSVLGAKAPDEPATIVNAEIITNNQETTLFIDDGTGYETKNIGVGYEILTDSALGGETHFQLKTGGRQASITKAELVSNIQAPYDVRGGDRLAIKIGEEIKEHIFNDSDFLSPGAATAYEIAASINANSDLHFEAVTRDGGKLIAFRAKSNNIDDIQAVDVSLGRNVRDLLGLSHNKIETVKLFKNKKPLVKDGIPATILTKKQAQWSPTITSGDTLIINVDDTGWKTYTITHNDFIEEGTYTTVAASNSLESWVNVFNKKLTGVTASIIGEQISLRSNLGESARASLKIDPSSTLVIKGMFDVNALQAFGKSADFVLSRNTAQLSLREPLHPGDKLSAGIDNTSAFVEFDVVSGGTINLQSTAIFYIIVDDPFAKIINTGLGPNTFITVTKPSTNIVRYTSSIPNAFSTLKPGDYVINVSEELNVNNRLEGRVLNVSPSYDFFDLEVTASEFNNAVPESNVLYRSGIVFVRTSNVPYKVRITPGTKDLYQIAQEIQSQVPSIKAYVEDDEKIILESYTKETTGSLLIPYFNQSAELFGLNKILQANAYESMTAFATALQTEAIFPKFKHSVFLSEKTADPTTSTINDADANPAFFNDIEPEGYIGYLNKYNQNDSQPVYKYNEISNIDYSAGNIKLKPTFQIKRIRLNDRFYIAYPVDLASEDFIVTIYDSDIQNKTYKINLFRTIKTNTTFALNSTGFNADDYEVTPPVPLTAYFNNFDFSNFRAYMRAKRVLNQQNDKDAILFRSKVWGPSGEKIAIGYYYPTSENNDVNHIVEFKDYVNVKLFLKSGPIIPTTIDGTTGWNITITPNTPVAGVDQVTYTWNGVGSAPGLSGLSGGEYVTISTGGTIHPKNTGTFRISDLPGFTPTANSFTITRKNGEAVAENNVYTVVPSVFKFYQAAPTTALDIVNYVNNNLQDLITAEIVDDNGTDGTGIIQYSTFEHTNFQEDALFLKDGIAHILSSNINGAPQFTLKRPLSYISDVGYAFNNGEEIRLVPTSIDQVFRFINNPAVSGVSLSADIYKTQDNKSLTLITKTIGGNGSILVSGGPGNLVAAPIIAAAERHSNYILARTNSFVAKQLSRNQLVKLKASTKQIKRVNLNSNNTITITQDVLNNESYVKIDQKYLRQNLFGRPRINTGLMATTNFKIEKQGSLVCLSHGDNSPSPNFSIINPDLLYSGQIEVIKNSDGTVLYSVHPSSNVLFTHINIGDKITISGMSYPENNGEFYVEGVLPKQLLVFNPNGRSQLTYATITITDNQELNGDEFVITTSSTYTFVAGTDFPIGATENETALNLAAVINTVPELQATVNNNVIHVESTQAGFPSYNIVYNNISGAPGATVVNFQHHTFTNSSFIHRLEVQEGDLVEFYPHPGLAPSNIGKFRVIRSYGNSIYFENADVQEQEFTATPLTVNTNVFSDTELNVTHQDGVLTIEWTGNGGQPDFKNIMPGDYVTLGTGFDINNQGTWFVMAGGHSNKFSLWVPNGVSESNLTNVNIVCQRPAFKFWPYDAVIEADTLNITSDVLNVNNRGTWIIKRAISNQEIVVDGLMANINAQALGPQADTVFVLEKDPYVGYKNIIYCHVDPDNNDQAIITFDTYHQYEKINESAGVILYSVNKLNLPQNLIKGLFAYKYDVGLIGEANRIVYGDPRNPIKYPGVAAAGAEIFIREPLIKRIKLTIDVRVQTGRPFNLIVEQVRNRVAALINSNPMGESIAISKIIAAVNSISGVRAVAISSPLYDNQNDLIKLQPFEKAKILDPIADIAVKKIGL